MLSIVNDEPQRSSNFFTDYPRAQYLLMRWLVHFGIDRARPRAARLGSASGTASA